MKGPTPRHLGDLLYSITSRLFLSGLSRDGLSLLIHGRSFTSFWSRRMLCGNPDLGHSVFHITLNRSSYGLPLKQYTRPSGPCILLLSIAVLMAVSSGSPSATNELQTNIHNMPPRSFSNDETRRGDNRPTLPPIRDLFGRELSQPLHPNAPGIPAHYSPPSDLSHRELPDESSYRGEQNRSNYTPSHVHARDAQLRPLTTPHQSPQRIRQAVYTTPAPHPHSFVPFQHESHDNAPVPTLSSRSRSGYGPEGDNYNPEPTRNEDARWGIHAREPAHGRTQYSYPPPSPVPPHQSYPPSSASRATPVGYQYARPMATSYSGSGTTVIPSGLVALEPTSAKYECSYCRKGFTRPSSLRIHVHSHTGERPFKCTFEGCNRTFSVQSNMRRHARTHTQSGNEARESEGEDESEEGSPQPQATQTVEVAPPR